MRCLDLENNAECRFAAAAAVALGNFDGVHIGHRRVFEALGDDAPTAVFTFSDLRRDGLICTLEERLSLIHECGVRYAAVADFADVKQMPSERFVQFLCSSLSVRRLVCGFNFTFGAGASATSEDLVRLAARYNVETIVVPALEADGEQVSSSRIREYIRNGDIPRAEALLGRRYGFTLPVVHGKALGRKMGSPTINQLIPKQREAPRFGVYASYAVFNEKRYESVTNVGVCPTVGGEKVCAETHIFDRDDDLYGKDVRVELCAFIRPEIRFSSVEELFARITEDKIEAKRYFAKR